MVFRPDDPVAFDPAPGSLGQPVDAPTPMTHVRDSEAVRSFRSAVAYRNGHPTRPAWAKLRSWVGRVSGRSDRHLLLVLAASTDALMTHCDEMVERLTRLEAGTADTARVFGEELARLRAEVVHLRNAVALHDEPPT